MMMTQKRKWRRTLPCFGVLSFMLSSTVLAKNLGTIGKTYPIGEQDFLEYIQQKLLRLQKNGKLAALQKSMKKKAIQSIHNPKAVSGIRTANANKTYYYDPTITVSQDIRDNKGRLIHPKGRRINPLDTLSMNSIMVFVKGDDPAQMRWAMAYKKKAKLLVKIILVSGPVIDLMKKHKTRLYFDQKGKLTQRFNIQQVPARVYQEGKRLRIDELLVMPKTRNQQFSQFGAVE